MRIYVQMIIDYIEDHIEEPLTIEGISNHVGYSRFYLHRLFLAYTGYSIMDYLRSRKMQYALRSLKNGQRVLDVALAYGYASERSFRRAFKLIYHESPSIMRTRDFSLERKINLEKIGGIQVLPYLSEVKTVKLKAYFAVGHQVISRNPEEESIRYMRDYRLRKGLDPISEIGSDVPVGSNESDQGKHGYVQYLVLSKEDFFKPHDENLIKKKVEASTYIMLKIEDPFKNPFERIPNGFKKLIHHLNEHNAYNEDLSIGSFEESVKTMHESYMNIYIAIKT